VLLVEDKRNSVFLGGMPLDHTDEALAASVVAVPALVEVGKLPAVASIGVHNPQF